MDTSGETQDRIQRGIESGNIHISSSRGIVEQSESFLEEKRERDELIKEVQRNKNIRTITVPTNDSIVQLRLRQLSQPIQLFGELAPDRRERLRMILADVMTDEGINVHKILNEQEGQSITESTAVKAFYTVGSPSLKRARENILKYSSERCKVRLGKQKERFERLGDPEEENQELKEYMELEDRLRDKFTSLRTEVGGSRSISCVDMMNDGSCFITGCWDGSIKIWDTNRYNELYTCKLYDGYDRITDVAFHPNASLHNHSNNNNVHFASANVDSTIRLYSLPDNNTMEDDNIKNEKQKHKKLQSKALLSGHTSRCSRIEFHPSGEYLVSTSYDQTFRLWDIQNETCILTQQGHSSEVYALGLHPDGSLIVTGDLGGVCLLWDIRSGKSIMNITTHAKQVLSADISPNGYHIATASGDAMIHIHDIRKKKNIYKIPAHQNIVTDVKFQPKDGLYIASCSFDGNLKLWSAIDYRLIKSIAGHDARINRLSMDYHGDNVVTVASDRNYKLWSTTGVL